MFRSLLFLILMLLVSPRSASAQEVTKQQCVDSHVRAQQQRLSGELVGAKVSLQTCANKACPDVVQRDCFGWLEDIDGEVPTVVFEAADENGAFKNVVVRLEGKVIAKEMNGLAIALDPGSHDFVFESEDGRIRRLNVFLRQGDSNRVVSADFRRGEPWLTLRVPPAAAVAGGISVVAASIAIGFGTSALIRQSKALDTCAPNCDEAKSNSIARSALIADISGAVAVVSGIVTLALVTHAGRERNTVKTATISPTLTTTGRSAFFGLTGAF